MVRALHLLVLLLVPAASATAQQADTARARRARRDSIAARPLERTVVTASRGAVTVGGASIVQLRLDSLGTPPAPTLEQALRRTPFVLVRQNSRGEAELSVRGSDSRQGAVLLDGLPISLGWDHRADPSLLPLSGASRLVLVRGLSTLLAGPNTLGGVVDVDVVEGEAGRVRERAVTLAASADRFGSRVLAASVAAPAGAISLRGGVAHRARDGVALPAAVRVPDGDPAHGSEPGIGNGALRSNTDLRQTDLFGALRWDRSGGGWLGLLASGYRAERGAPPELHLAAPRFWRYPEQRRLLLVASGGTGLARTPFGFGSAGVSAGANLGRTDITRFRERTFTTVEGREAGDERTVSARLTATHTLPANGELRLATTIADVRYDETLDDAAPGRYRQRLHSVGLEGQLPVAGDLLLSLGVARDGASTPEAGGRARQAPFASWGWRLGATTLVARDAVRMHGAVSRRARFAALRELYSGALDRFVPNPALRPETLLGAEAGATIVAGALAERGLAAQAVVYAHRLDDAVVRVTAPQGRFVRVNRDALRSTGVELLAGWNGADVARAAPAIPRWWRGVAVTGDLLVQRVRVIDRTLVAGAERFPEHQPRVRGSVDLGLPVGAGVRGRATARFVGTQFCTHPELDRQLALGRTGAADLALERGWAVGGGLWREVRATVALDNATDATVWDQCGLPQPGRTLRFGVSVR